MVVEDIDIIYPQAFEALIKAGNEVFPRAKIAIGSGPHIKSGLGGDDQFVPVGRQVELEDVAEGLFGRAIGRSIVVGQIQVCDTVVKGGAHCSAPIFKHIDAAKIMPQAEREQRELNTAVAARLYVMLS